MERSDTELMLCAQEGDLRSFALLTQRYRAPLHRFFASLLLDASQADDCVQETFLRLWLLRRDYAPIGKFSTYLFQLGKNHLLNQQRKLRAQAAHYTDDDGLNVTASVEDQPEQCILRRDRHAQVRQAVASLPPRLRVVVELAHARQHTYAEIAQQLQIPVGTVKSRMFEANRRLRQTLQEDNEL